MRWCGNADAAAGGASVNTMIGARSSEAQATPFTIEATPGPSVLRQAPGRPVISALGGAGAAGGRGWRARGARPGRFGCGQHESQSGAAGCRDQIEIAAAARNAEDR